LDTQLFIFQDHHDNIKISIAKLISMPIKYLRLVALAAMIALPASAFAADVTVKIRLAAADALEVSYELPEDCNRLDFQETGASYRQFRSSWKAADDCGKVDGAIIEAHCRSVRFRVPASSVNLGGFPGAFPMGEGIWLHTAKYAVAATCGTVGFRFVAPGSIALAGKLHRAMVASADPSAADTSVLLLATELPATDGPIMYFSPTVGADMVARIKQVSRETVAFFGAAMPNVRFRPNVLAATALTAADGAARYEGDADETLRLAFFNWPATLDQAGQRTVTKFVSHEMSHRFQLRDEIGAYPDARLIHEGGAEFMRWMLAVRKGWLTHAEAAAELDGALAECMLGTGTRGWADVPPQEIGGRRLEYHCGLAAYVYSLAARQGKGTALARLDRFYQQVRLGRAPNFAQMLECGDSADCKPRWLPGLLGRGPSMASEWSRLFDLTRLATPVAATSAQRDVMMLKAIGQLMKSDCGSSSLFPTSEGVIVDDVKTCKTLRPEMHVTQVEGFPMFGHADALPALVAACSAGGKLRLATKAGQALAIACGTPPFQAQKLFYAADIERVIASLEESFK
jgi:hypothetical protein